MSSSRGHRTVVAARALRGFADGLVSVVLPGYLLGQGHGPREVGAIVTATLVGSAAITLTTGLSGQRLQARTVLLAGCGLMALTGVGFAITTAFTVLLIIAFVGTMNPSGSDVSLFLPVEQALLAEQVAYLDAPRVYARYNLAGALAAAAGSLAAALDPDRLAFLAYTVVAIVLVVLYRQIPRRDVAVGERRRALHTSRRIVLQLAALFSLDSAGSGFAVQSILVLWLYLRFDLSTAGTATVFFVASALAGFSHLVAGRLAARIGLVPTMVFTHIPANVCLAAAAFAPSAPTAIALLLVRAALSQMDVPARQAFVMAAVEPDERAAAASVTNVPRSLAAAATPFLGGALLEVTDFGWPLVIAGITKLAYDLLLLGLFGRWTPDRQWDVRT